MSPLNMILSLFLVCITLSSYAQPSNEFDDSFIDEQLEKATNDPNNRVVLDIDQPIGVVFRSLLSELSSYSDDVVSTTFDNSKSNRLNELDIGSRRVTTMENTNMLVQKIILFDPPHSFAYFTEMSGSTISAPIDYSIGLYKFSEQANGRTTVEVSAAYKSSSRLTAFLVRFAFNRAFKQDFGRAEKYLNSIERK